MEIRPQKEIRKKKFEERSLAETQRRKSLTLGETADQKEERKRRSGKKGISKKAVALFELTIAL